LMKKGVSKKGRTGRGKKRPPVSLLSREGGGAAGKAHDWVEHRTRRRDIRMPKKEEEENSYRRNRLGKKNSLQQRGKGVLGPRGRPSVTKRRLKLISRRKKKEVAGQKNRCSWRKARSRREACHRVCKRANYEKRIIGGNM